MTDPRFAKWLAELPPELVREPNPYERHQLVEHQAEAMRICCAAFRTAALASGLPSDEMAAAMAGALGVYLGAACPEHMSPEALTLMFCDSLRAARQQPVVHLAVVQAVSAGLPPLRAQLAKDT